jgi:xanthine dehydrogenase FAD-binding subunit
VEELRGIHESATEVRIGAATTHSELMRNPLIADRFPLLRQAARHIGAPAVRNMGTLGGNICTASPAGDTLPPLYILNADVELCSFKGRRRMPIGAFIPGPGRTQLEEGEVLCAVVIGKEQGFDLHHFEKVGQRKAMAISVASLAFAAETRRDGTIVKARCAFGSVAPMVFTSRLLNDTFAGNALNTAVLERAAAIVREGVNPISDIRASMDYRRQVAGNLVMRLEGAG